jgi:hypothetical protein
MKVLVLCAFVLIGAPPRAWAQLEAMKPQAWQHLKRGLELYQHEDYDAALRELLAGQAIDARPEFYFALGQVERKLGNCKKAIAYYEVYLDHTRTPDQERAAQHGIEQCRALSPDSKPEPASPPPAAAPAPALAPAEVAPARSTPEPLSPQLMALAQAGARPRSHAWLDGTLVGGGLASVLTGSLLLWHYHGLFEDAHKSYDGYQAASDAGWQRTFGWAAVSVGGAAVLGGVVDAALHLRRGRLEPGVGPGSASLSWRSAF